MKVEDMTIPEMATEIASLLLLLKECYGVLDAVMARLIIHDRTFMPPKSPYWPTVEKLVKVLRDAEMLP